jgi:predicted nucleic acid-binding protein
VAGAAAAAPHRCDQLDRAAIGGCREGESGRVEAWLETFSHLPIDDAIALKSVRLRQRHGLKIPDAIILATARYSNLNLANRSSRDFPLTLGGVVHPYAL